MQFVVEVCRDRATAITKNRTAIAERGAKIFSGDVDRTGVSDAAGRKLCEQTEVTCG